MLVITFQELQHLLAQVATNTPILVNHLRVDQDLPSLTPTGFVLPLWLNRQCKVLLTVGLSRPSVNQPYQVQLTTTTDQDLQLGSRAEQILDLVRGVRELHETLSRIAVSCLVGPGAEVQPPTESTQS